ncbi:hypothetical protein H6F67_22470 [Microcoleus sp. FACHB-1515]|uniref:hypothetical protein n=1 Tax=Cyanophyceae TaxID=3028117 RepID=UPI00168505C4|nr:hypothetical protein [Microcoleus sp. FACHB-1515]MBD2092618.1 hypothetical protein [Microcoleus sp. FACHB-1515]
MLHRATLKCNSEGVGESFQTAIALFFQLVLQSPSVYFYEECVVSRLQIRVIVGDQVLVVSGQQSDFNFQRCTAIERLAAKFLA